MPYQAKCKNPGMHTEEQSGGKKEGYKLIHRGSEP